MRIGLAFLSVLLFYFAVLDLALLILQKRYKGLYLAVPILFLTYFLEQCLDMAVAGTAHAEAVIRFIKGFAALPDGLLLVFCLVPATALSFIFRNIRRYGKRQITRMSVKEAMDGMPAGILCYASGAGVLLANHAMEDFCRKTTGAELIDGATFREQLLHGELLPSCERLLLGDETVIVLSDGEARKVSESDIPYEKNTVRMLVAYDIT